MDILWLIESIATLVAAMIIPWKHWHWKTLFCLSFISSLFMLRLKNGTNDYGYWWWTWEEIILLWFMFSIVLTGIKLGKIFTRPWWIFVATTCSFFYVTPRSNIQMQKWEILVLLICSMTSLALYYIFKSWILLAAGLFSTLRLIAVLIWAWNGYNPKTLMITQLTGIVMISIPYASLKLMR